jgi:hypothetical protein
MTMGGRRGKGGEPVLYGGLPIASFEKLVAEEALQQAGSSAHCFHLVGDRFCL